MLSGSPESSTAQEHAAELLASAAARTRARLRPRSTAMGTSDIDHPDRLVAGVARVDRRTKRLVKRLQPGEIAVIDHDDLDRVAAETLVEAGAGAVVNAGASISGRYPNVGPLLVAAAGIPLLDGVGADVHGQRSQEGNLVTIDGDHVLVGRQQGGDRHPAVAVLVGARLRGGPPATSAPSSSASPRTPWSGCARSRHLLTDVPEVPDVGVDFKGRHALIVVRGLDYREDLAVLRQSGYLQEMKPVLIGVDGGADALLELGLHARRHHRRLRLGVGAGAEAAGRRWSCTPTRAARRRAPTRLDDMGVSYELFESAGTSEDIAMLLAHEHGAELIVAVGTHNSMVEFLDKGRQGMASTILVRMRVGLDARRRQGRVAPVPHPRPPARSGPAHPGRRCSPLPSWSRSPSRSGCSCARSGSCCRELAMINIRYHIISLVAVFLALGVGVALGSAFIDTAVVGQLEQNIDTLCDPEERAAGRERSDARPSSTRSNASATEAGAELLGGQLDGVPTYTIATRGIEEEPVERTTDAMIDADADFGGTLWLTERLALERRVRPRRPGPGPGLEPSVAEDADALRDELVLRLGNALADPLRTEDPLSVDPGDGEDIGRGRG